MKQIEGATDISKQQNRAVRQYHLKSASGRPNRARHKHRESYMQTANSGEMAVKHSKETSH